MANKAVQNSSPIPKTATHATEQGYKKVNKTPPVSAAAATSTATKAKWALVQPGSPHIVCYYDPNTGEYTDCHSSDDS
jgi:hypothetical protein